MNEPGAGHALANALLLFFIGLCGLMSCVSVGVNLVEFVLEIPAIRPDYNTTMYRLGGLTFLVWVGAWSVAVTALAPLAGIGLLQRSARSRKLAMTVWVLNAIGCFFFAPLSIYGLWSLTRPHVRALLEPDS